MSNERKRTGGMKEYLDSLGILVNGSEEDIKKAKRHYRQIYFTKRKRKQRAENPEFTIRFSKENGDYSKVICSAQKHKMTNPEFIKSAVLAYINKTYIVPDRLLIAELEQLLSQCLNEIQTIVRQKERYSFERERKYEVIEKRIEKLEEEIHKVLKCPYTIEEVVQKEIVDKPSLKEHLLGILSNSHDNQNQVA